MLKFSPQLEWWPPHVDTSVDIKIDGRHENGSVVTVAIEVDGPQHFTKERHRTRKTRERDAKLLLHGLHVRSAYPLILLHAGRAPRHIALLPCVLLLRG